MEENLKEIIEEHQINLVKYTQERDSINAKMQFMREHNFENELQYLRTQKVAMEDIFCDYRKAVEDLRKLITALQS